LTSNKSEYCGKQHPSIIQSSKRTYNIFNDQKKTHPSSTLVRGSSNADTCPETCTQELLAAVRKTETIATETLRSQNSYPTSLKELSSHLHGAQSQTKTPLEKVEKELPTCMEGRIRPRVLIAARLISGGALEMSGLKRRTSVGSSKYMYSSTLPVHCQTLSESG
jgi:hypothetical protein